MAPKLKLDPKAKLIALAMVNVAVIMQHGFFAQCVIVAMIAAYLAAIGRQGFAARGIVVYATLGVFVRLLATYQSIVFGVLSFTLIAVMKMFPLVFYAGSVLSTTRIGEIMSALQSFRLPKHLVIMLAIVFRFFPSARQELIGNSNALKLRARLTRGIPRRLSEVVSFTLVPIRSRSELISDELSQAALLKGIESPVTRTSAFESRLTVCDALFLAYFSVMLLFAAVAR